ncbi:MAG: hypothetical protein KUG77_09495 [Nannocystaceae bacterium]|nr:hypothetical protein [Nannocystaceae bacterium]
MAAFWTSLATAGWLLLAAPGPSAELDGARWRGLQQDPERAPGPQVLDRRVQLTIVPGGVEIRGTWRLTTQRPAWYANVLLAAKRVHVRSVRLGGKPARTWSTPDGLLVIDRIQRDTVLEIEAFVPGSADKGLELGLLGAPRGEVVLKGGDALQVVDLEDRPVLRNAGRFITGTGRLRVERRALDTSDSNGTLCIAHVGIGLTVGDGAVTGQAHVRWEVRRGELESVSFHLQDVGSDLQVEGPNVAEWKRSGDRVEVQLRQPENHRVDLQLSWTAAVSKAAESTLQVPTIEPLDVFRTQSALQLARDGEVDIIPRTSGWTTIAAAQLPQWSRGLVQGVPTAAFQRPGANDGGALGLVRYVAVPTPPMVINVADIRIASSREGRYVMRARYEVLNERAAHLVFRPPAGARLTGVTVAGRPVRPARDGDAYRIPLPRSVETVDGLSLVPIVVGLRGEDTPWKRRARGDIALPTVDAPVAVLRSTHGLPPGYASRLKPGEGSVVEAFSRGEGVAYGLADDGRASQADQLYADALDAWNSNEFKQARAKLDQLDELGADNNSTRGLESNVELVLGPTPQTATVSRGFSSAGSTISSPDAPTASAPPAPASKAVRRIKAQVRARSEKERNRFRIRKKKAKSLQEAGRYDEAEEEYEKALEEAKDLDRLEDDESRSYDYEAEEIEGELETTRSQKESRKSLEQAEYDMLSGGYQLFAGTTDAPVQTRQPLPRPIVPIVVPTAGATVSHEFSLLEPGASRRIEFDARHRIERRRRR